MARTLTHLERLEAESIQIMREVVSESEKPVMLYSVGKDSAVMLHLAKKAFYPSPPPFPLMHVDTTWKFKDMYALRDKAAREAGMELLVYQNPEAKERGINPFDHGPLAHRHVEDRGAEAGARQIRLRRGVRGARGGTRRSLAPRRGSSRSDRPITAGIPRISVPNCGISTMRARPRANRSGCSRSRTGPSSTSGSTSSSRTIEIVPLYFAAKRPTYVQDGQLFMADDLDRMEAVLGHRPEVTERSVRFRTLGCFPPERRGRERGGDAQRGDPGDAAHDHVGAAGARDRSRSGGVDGEEEAGRVFLMAAFVALGAEVGQVRRRARPAAAAVFSPRRTRRLSPLRALRAARFAFCEVASLTEKVMPSFVSALISLRESAEYFALFAVMRAFFSSGVPSSSRESALASTRIA